MKSIIIDQANDWQIMSAGKIQLKNTDYRQI